MALPDIQFPDIFQGMQVLPGPRLFKGSWFYSYFKDGNNWSIYNVHDVISIDLADHLITPEAGEDYRTDWFDVIVFANAYRLQCHFWVKPNPQYTYQEFRILDENDQLIAWSTQFDGIVKGSGATSQGTYYNLPVMCLKVCLFSQFATNPADVESGPLPGTSLAYLRLRWFFGGSASATTPMNLPSGGVVKQCTFNQLDEVKASWQSDVFNFSDVDAANNYFKTHGKPIPNDYPPFVPSGLPQDFDPSGPGGGDGNYDDTSDPIDFPDLPIGGAMACGAVHAFHVTSGIITSMFQKLWSTSILDLDTWQKLVTSPLDCIISLHALPFAPVDGASKNIYFGNFDTQLTSPIVANQYVTIDCGYIDVTKFFGSAMDYSPYTKFQIYLPFSGIHSLTADDVQATRVHVKYNIDVLTGDCVINVKCGQSVLYKFTGNCKQQIPITARDSTALGNLISGVAGVAIGAVKGAAFGPEGAVIGAAGAGIAGAVSVAMRKETVTRSGDLSGATGILDDFTPYLIIHRPQQSLAVDYNKFKGYPSNITAVLGTLSGYTEVEHINLQSIPNATSDEMNEIKNLLQNGVLL